MKIFHHFRKIIFRFIFSVPPSTATARSATTSTMSTARPHGRKSDNFQSPRVSCSSSSYYSSNSGHYSEAIADCIEFLNNGRKSHVMCYGRYNRVTATSCTSSHRLKLAWKIPSNRRYGLLGLNGCGKSTLLAAIGCRELPIPDHMDVYHLTREIEASDMSALQAVISCDEERIRLENEVESLAIQVWSE
ncbi:hypothetical protein Ancab_028651 [Ancistrocladus abbreviatus]